MVPFPITFTSEAVNEQMNDEAQMFMEAATALIAQKHDDALTRKDKMKIARLYEYAARAYLTACARTIGHKKSDRYERQYEVCHRRAHFWYRRALDEHLTAEAAPPHVATLLGLDS